VYHNEKPGNVPFPGWMKPSWHNCIIGCMTCQNACPVDRKLLGWVEDEEEFSEAETKLLVEGVKVEGLPEATVKKLQHLSLVEEIDKFPRNLGVFLRLSSDSIP
jgi:epoxyqueuosine reductase